MKQTLYRPLIIGLMILPLAACGGGGNNNRQPPPPVATPTPPPVATPTPPPATPPPPTPPPATGRVEDQFGAGFAAFFRAANWSEPGDPKDGDVIPVSRDRDPVNF